VGDCYPNLPEVITPAENHDWGTTDLFPTFGMPSCPRRNLHTDRSRAVTTGDLQPMAPPGIKRSPACGSTNGVLWRPASKYVRQSTYGAISAMAPNTANPITNATIVKPIT
jgi:hypothetical protein